MQDGKHPDPGADVGDRVAATVVVTQVVAEPGADREAAAARPTVVTDGKQPGALVDEPTDLAFDALSRRECPEPVRPVTDVPWEADID